MLWTQWAILCAQWVKKTSANDGNINLELRGQQSWYIFRLMLCIEWAILYTQRVKKQVPVMMTWAAATEHPAAAAALANSSTAWNLETRALHPVCLLQVMLRNRLSHHHAKSMYLACPHYQNDWNGGVSHVHNLDIREAVKSTTLWPCSFASLLVEVWWRVHIWNNGPKQKFMSVRFMSHLSTGNCIIV